ncbi:hypothetical protein [Corynebacterium freiburgense]|uniref:hypothetical protein n=1 Tax=Corynebacterium freiburgense TaxID=556548 RepID=UPI000426F6B9|nr:hypothetical protein [Corynebacterium freiburgense]WJZ03611.1 hypothetical protein CFREI_11765 [Corynebacterium freiburgense]
MKYTLVEHSPLRHTYPFGKNDIELEFGSSRQLLQKTAEIYGAHPGCRRIIVAVDEGDIAAISECEDAGFRYVLDVQLREGKEVSLMVHEPLWVTEKDTEEVDLT